MIKKAKIILPVIFIIIVLLLFNNVYAKINFAAGEHYFKKQAYQTARQYYKRAYSITPENSVYKDKYIETLTQLPLDYYTQKELFHLLKGDNASPALIEAYKRIELFKDNILTHFDDNYIAYCLQNSSVIRWDESKFPLKVYIKKSDNLTSNQEKIIKDAFHSWEDEFQNFFKFSFTDDSENADILVDFEFKLDEEADKDTTYVTANTVPNIEGNLLKSMEISLNLTNPFGEKVSDDDLYTTSLHEIGHALGIMGHSSDFHDLMYVGGTSKFSKRDINTVKLLYLLFPDITNSPLRTLSTDRKIYAPIITGENFEQDQKLYTKATTYINRSPELSLGWTLLGTYYYKTQDYPKAIKAFLKAKSLARFDNERFEINGNLGLVYITIKDYPNAIFYLSEAQKYSPSPELETLHGFALIQTGEKTKGVQMMQKAFSAQPANMEIGFMLADYYYSEMNFRKTIKVLKTLKKNNADYIYSPERRKYMILNLFVSAPVQNTQYRV